MGLLNISGFCEDQNSSLGGTCRNRVGSREKQRLENTDNGQFHARYPHSRPKNASGCTCAPRSFSGATPLICPPMSVFRAKIVHPFSRFSGMVTGVTGVAGVAGLWNVCDDRRTMENILQHGCGVRNPLHFGGRLWPFAGQNPIICPEKPGNRRPFPETNKHNAS